MLRDYRRLLPIAAREWRLLLVIVVLSITTSAVAILSPWPLKLLIDQALEGAPTPTLVREALESIGATVNARTLLVLAALASLLVFLVDATVNLALSWCWAAAGQRMVYDLSAHLFGRLQRLSLLFHNRRSVGDSLDRLATDTYCIYTATEGLLVTPATQLLTVVGVASVAWTIDHWLTAVSLTTALTTAVGAWALGGWLKQHAQRNRESQARLVEFVQQTLSAVPLIQVYDAADHNRRHFNELAASAISANRQNAKASKMVTLPTGLATAMGTGFILFSGGQRVLMGTMTVGSLVVFLAYLRTMETAFGRLLQTWTKLKSAEASLDRVLEVLDTPHVIRDTPHARPIPSRKAGESGQICFENVTFGYEPNRPVLFKVELNVQPGETIALVGPTGAGKSTMASLIPRFFRSLGRSCHL